MAEQDVGLPFDKPATTNDPPGKVLPDSAKGIMPATENKVPPQAPVVPAQTAAVQTNDPIRKLLISQMGALQNFLGNQENALRFMSAVAHAVQKVPALRECTTESLLGAFMECAALGLYPGNASGDCYVLPYKNDAQFQMGYRGFKTLAFRAGIKSCGTDVVHENDEFLEERGTVQKLTHVPAEGDRGQPIGAYAWAKIGDEIVFRYMKKEDILKIKEKSKSKNSEYSPWASKNDPMLWMWQKTVFKQLAKLLPTSEVLDRAVYVDNVNERGGHVAGAERNVVEVPFEATEDEQIESGKARKAAMRGKKKA